MLLCTHTHIYIYIYKQNCMYCTVWVCLTKGTLWACPVNYYYQYSHVNEKMMSNHFILGLSNFFDNSCQVRCLQRVLIARIQTQRLRETVVFHGFPSLHRFSWSFLRSSLDHVTMMAWIVLHEASAATAGPAREDSQCFFRIPEQDQPSSCSIDISF